MAEPDKTISVAMCTFNGERYVGQQLESFSRQSRLPDELVVCDDGSTDNTIEIVQRFAASAQFPVRLQVNPRKLGLVKNFEKAIGLCKANLIALSDQDDIWLPEKLARFENEFACAPEVGLVFSDAELIDEDGRRAGQLLWSRVGLEHAERARLKMGKGISQLLTGATVTGATMAFRAEYQRLVLPIPETVTLIHDGWIALLIACVAKVLPIEHPLVLYRQHAGQQIGPRARRSLVGGLSALAAGQTRDAMRRANPYAEVLTTANSARQRLVELRGEYNGRRAIANLDALSAHLKLRSKLPSSHWQRIGSVLGELFTLRYFRFSNGLSSAAKDLMRADRGTDHNARLKA